MKRTIECVNAFQTGIERFWTLRRKAVLPPNLFQDTVQAFRVQGASAELIRRLNENSFLGRVFAAGIANVKSSREVMKEAMEETGRAVMVEMERFLNGLGTIATVAPLLGLFGTVVGMIEIFGASGSQATSSSRAEEARMGTIRETGSLQRWLPLSGLAFVVIVVVTFAGVAGDTPESDASAAKVAASRS